MGFLTPKLPPTPKPANPAINPATVRSSGQTGSFASILGSVSPGLSRKSNKDKVSLIGGG